MTAPQVFITPSGDEMVILAKADYDALIEAAADAEEDAADAAIFDERMADIENGTELTLSPQVSALVLKGSSRLQAIRKTASEKFTQAEAAEKVGISQAYMSALEAGERRITPEIAQKLANLYGVPLAWVD